MSTKVNFRDSNCASIHIASSWKSVGRDSRKNVDCQTPEEFYKFSEMETQTGIGTQIIQSQVGRKDDGTSLLDYFSTTQRQRSKDDWKQSIENGLVTVDGEVCADPTSKVHEEYFLECVNMKRDVEVSA